MRSYRETLLDASRALEAEGDLNMRLSQVACLLMLLDDDDVPPHALGAFDRLREPLIAKPLFVKARDGASGSRQDERASGGARP